MTSQWFPPALIVWWLLYPEHFSERGVVIDIFMMFHCLWFCCLTWKYWQQKGIRCKIFTICTVELNFSANDILLLSLFHIHIHSTGKICLKSFKISSVQKLLKEKKYTNFQIIRQKLAPGLQKNKPFMLNYLVHIYVSRLNAVFRLFPYGI